MLKQRCNRLIVANSGKKVVAFLLSSFVDFDRLLLSEFILVRALRTRLQYSSFSHWFRGKIRGRHKIYNNRLHVVSVLEQSLKTYNI